jgi:hypothetical protein
MSADARSRNIILTTSMSLYMIIVSLSMTFRILAKAVSFALSSSMLPMLSGFFFSCHFFFQKRQRKMKSAQKLRRFQESSYMDPNQSLCLGALFNIAATNVNICYFLLAYHI